MALAKEIVVDKIEIIADGTIHIRHATYFTEDGIRVTEPDYHRVAFTPIEDIPDAVGDKKQYPITKIIKDIATIVRTPAVIQAFKDKLPKLPGT